MPLFLSSTEEAIVGRRTSSLALSKLHTLQCLLFGRPEALVLGMRAVPSRAAVPCRFPVFTALFTAREGQHGTAHGTGAQIAVLPSRAVPFYAVLV